MNPSARNGVIISGEEDGRSTQTLRSIVRKSALLNIVIVLTSAPVLIVAGGPKAVVPTLEIMAGISFLIWTSTFSVFSFVSLARIYWTPPPTAKRSRPSRPANGSGVADRWLDGSV